MKTLCLWMGTTVDAGGRWPFLAVCFVLGVLLEASAGCPPSPAPTPWTPASVVYRELVEAGCLDPSDGGEDFIGAARSLPRQPAWLMCLFDGGTVAACGVPCE